MSLFLNALKTLADRPEAGFPPVGGDGSPDNANSSGEQASTAGQQVPAASKQAKEQTAPSPAAIEKDKLTEVARQPSSNWSSLWQQAVADPTPIEATPDSPEDVALADLAEMAEIVKSPRSETPQHPAEAMPRDPVSTSPTQVEELQPEASTDAETARTEPEAADEKPASNAAAEEAAQEIPGEASLGDVKEFEAQENLQYSEEMKYIFAPWFEAQDKEAEAESKPFEPAESAERSHPREEEAKEAVAAHQEVEEATEESIDESAIEDQVDEVEQTSVEAQKSEAEDLQAAHADLLAEEEQPASAAPDETWELYDRTTDWSTTRSGLAKQLPETSEEGEPAVGTSLPAEQKPEPVGAATSSKASSEAEIPHSPIAAALASFAAEQKQQPQHNEREESESHFTSSQTPPAAVEAKPAGRAEEEVLEQRPEPVKTAFTSQAATDIRVTEPYLRLATRLCQSLGAGRPQAIALTSVDQAACKALNLAQLARALTLAEEGDVLVVQGSEARPELAERLGVIAGKRPRWARAGGGDLAEKIISNADGRLAMLPHHALRNSPIQLVDPLLLARCKRHYSLVLVETGDLSSEISQSLIAQSDIGLITAVLHATPRERASQAAALLRRLGVRISGCILNEARPAA